MTETFSPVHAPFVAGAPERLFRVGPLTQDGEIARGSMRTGTWMLGPGGEPCRGSLSVLADDVLSCAVIAQEPLGHWAVSTEISVDFCSTLPVDGSTLYAEGHPVEVDLAGGLARGRIVDRRGHPIAVGSARLRFIPQTPSGPVHALTPDGVQTADPLSTAALLRATTQRHDGGVILTLAASPDLSNPMGNVHGGISLCASEMAGLAALHSLPHPLVTASIRIAYLRSIPVDEDVSFTARVLHRGRTLGVAQVVSHNSAGKACTLATVTCREPS
jgi:uncharacterized protein (TIGR00369 family)